MKDMLQGAICPNGFAQGHSCQESSARLFAAVSARADKARWKLFFRQQAIAARMRKELSQADSGASTAEYAIVLIAATGFAGLLAGILKSGTVKSMLTDLVEKALTLR